MKKLIVISVLGGALLPANEALDLLDSELPGPGQVYLDSADPPKAAQVQAKKKTVPPDRALPERWNIETPSLVTFGDSLTTRIAPRGGFEYQYQDQRVARGAKLSRARLGVELETYYGIELTADVLLSSDGDYEGWDTLQVRVPLSEDIDLSFGKFPPQFGTEYTQDPSARWFPTLSPLLAQVAPASSLGMVAEGDRGGFEWKGGWFSGDARRDIPGIAGDGYLYVSVASSFNGSGGEEIVTPRFQRWHLDYIYNFDGNDSETIPMAYSHLLATGMQISAGNFDFYSDFLLAEGDDQTAWGVTAAGGYWLVEDAVRLVGRYHYANSREDGGVLVGWGVPGTGTDALGPFGSPASTSASELHSIYGGLNFHVFEDNLLLGTGLEYRNLSGVVGRSDFDSWGWNTWARFAF